MSADAASAWGAPERLIGRHVRLDRLREEDLAGLYHVTAPDTFRYYSTLVRMDSLEGFKGSMLANMARGDRWHMAARLITTGELVGSTAFYDLRPEHRGLEVGFTWYAPAHRGTAVNPECKLLMLGYAFDVLGCARVQIKTDGRNVHSQRAIEKLGARFEGRLRKQFVLADGFIRDTMMNSVTDEEWAGVKAGLEARLVARVG